MTIILELPPEQEAQLQKNAELSGLTVQDYLLRLAWQEAATEPLRSQEERDEWSRMFAAASRSFGPTPHTPPLEELDREHMYEDRD